jgi:trk system potassium uptake protein TrkH
MFQGRIIPDRAFLSIWMYFFGYTIALSVGIVALGTAGLDFETAVATSAASLSNMGPLLDAVMTGTLYSDFTSAQQFTAAMLMLLGRVEVLAVFAAISSLTDRRL